MKNTISVTHPNGEVSTRKTDRPYTHAVVVRVTTDRTLNHLQFKRSEVEKERDLWIEAINGTADVCWWYGDRDLTGQYYTTIVHILSNDGGKGGVFVKTERLHIDRDTNDDYALAPIAADVFSTGRAQLLNDADKRIKTLNRRIAKINAEIAHVESLGGETYAVNSWHSRHDLAAKACPASGWVVEIDA